MSYCNALNKHRSYHRSVTLYNIVLVHIEIDKYTILYNIGIQSNNLIHFFHEFSQPLSFACEAGGAGEAQARFSHSGEMVDFIFPHGKRVFLIP